MKKQDKAIIVYQGPPRWNGSSWINGDRFVLSGPRAWQGFEGVELSPGVSGLELPEFEYRWDVDANNPGAHFVSEVASRREISCSLNFLADTESELRIIKDRWFSNHESANPGKLWILTSNTEPRYLPVRRSDKAATGQMERDPYNFTSYSKMEWGWVSDRAYFSGYKSRKKFEWVDSSKSYRCTFYNPSTAERVYPQLYLPGPATWWLSLGYNQPSFKCPSLEEGEELKIDFNPRNHTARKKDKRGNIQNAWPAMVGFRPKFYLEPRTMNTFIVREVNSNRVPNAPRLEFTPEFESWT